jgi:hypothetical protein
MAAAKTVILIEFSSIEPSIFVFIIQIKLLLVPTSTTNIHAILLCHHQGTNKRASMSNFITIFMSITACDGKRPLSTAEETLVCEDNLWNKMSYCRTCYK